MMDDANAIPEWLRRKLVPGRVRPMAKKELAAKLDEQVRNGEITPDEAEHEYQDFVNPEPRFSAYPD